MVQKPSFSFNGPECQILPINSALLGKIFTAIVLFYLLLGDEKPNFK